MPVPAVSERWIGVMPKIVAKQASENPIVSYKQFLEGTVLTHPELFAHAHRMGGDRVGIGLTLGLLTGVIVADRAAAGDQLRAGDPVDVARAAGLSHRPVRA